MQAIDCFRTVASALNSLAAVTMQDFITEALGVRIHETHGAIWAKSLSIAYGAISFLMVVVPKSFSKKNYENNQNLILFVGFCCCPTR